jgi:hypothetical protein
MLQWVLSLIPWWLYALGAVAAYVAIRRYLGEKWALAYALLAACWVSYDKGGDDRAAYLRARSEAIVASADANLNKRADADWLDRLSRMAAEAKADKEKLDALEKASPDDCGPIPDAVLRGLQ